MSERARQWVAREFIGAQPATLATMMAMADLADDTGYLNASVEEIAEHANIGERTVKRAFVRLTKTDAIRRGQRRVNGKRVADETVLGWGEPQSARRPMKPIPAHLAPRETA